MAGEYLPAGQSATADRAGDVQRATLEKKLSDIHEPEKSNKYHPKETRKRRVRLDGKIIKPTTSERSS